MSLSSLLQGAPQYVAGAVGDWMHFMCNLALKKGKCLNTFTKSHCIREKEIRMYVGD